MMYMLEIYNYVVTPSILGRYRTSYLLMYIIIQLCLAITVNICGIMYEVNYVLLNQ